MRKVKAGLCFCAATLALIWLPGSVYGQYCKPYCPPPVYSPTVSYDYPPPPPPPPVVEYREKIVPVAYPVPYTIAVPVVSYLYSGAAFAPAFAAQPAAVAAPLAVPATAVTSTTATAGVSVAPAATFNADNIPDAVIDRIIERIELRMRQRNGSPRAPAIRREGPPPVRSSGAAEGLSVLQNRCAACHTGEKAKGGMTIFLADGSLNPKVDRRLLVDAADEGRMPKDSTGRPDPIPDDEVLALRNWERGG